MSSELRLEGASVAVSDDEDDDGTVKNLVGSHKMVARRSSSAVDQ